MLPVTPRSQVAAVTMATLVFLAWILVACAREPSAEDGSSPRSGDSSTTATSPSSIPGSPSEPCGNGKLVPVDGEIRIGEGQGPGPSRIAEFEWAAHPGCERTVLRFAGSDPVPELIAANHSVLGLLRLRLPWKELSETQVADTTLPGIVERAYVVRPLGADPTSRSGLVVDLHLRHSTSARVLLLGSPARVVVDLERPHGGYVNVRVPPIAVSPRVVVIEPAGGVARYPLEIRGYARTFEANVVARIRQGGRLVAESVTTAADWTATWGEFAISIPDGPRGRIELFVGEDSARDGTEEGVRIPLVMR